MANYRGRALAVPKLIAALPAEMARLRTYWLEGRRKRRGLPVRLDVRAIREFRTRTARVLAHGSIGSLAIQVVAGAKTSEGPTAGSQSIARISPKREAAATAVARTGCGRAGRALNDSERSRYPERRERLLVAYLIRRPASKRYAVRQS
jgi:hypothetical protein